MKSFSQIQTLEVISNDHIYSKTQTNCREPANDSTRTFKIITI